MADVRVPAARLEAYCTQLAEACGCSAGDAALLARSLVRSDMRGVHSHGIFRLPLYLRRLQAGGINPRGAPRVVQERMATAVVDGDNALGVVAGHAAMDRALTLAGRFGIGAVGCRNSNHFGAAAEYVLDAPARGCVGIAMTNAIAVMAPWQGASLVLGNNPIAVAAPTQGEPFVLDMAVSQVAKGKIRVAAAEGRAVPATWALDRQGRPTTDAREALAGFLAPMGAHKGYGLSLVVEILAGLLSGAVLAPVMPTQEQVETPNGVGHFFLALEIERFLPLAEFTARLSELCVQVRASERAPGFERVIIPGDLEREAEEEARRSGVAISRATWAALAHEAAALGVAVPDAPGDD